MIGSNLVCVYCRDMLTTTTMSQKFDKKVMLFSNTRAGESSGQTPSEIQICIYSRMR